MYYFCTICFRHRAFTPQVFTLDVQLSLTIIILISRVRGLNAVQASQAQRLKREREATRQMRLDKDRERGGEGTRGGVAGLVDGTGTNAS